jgi:hypothetical protein
MAYSTLPWPTAPPRTPLVTYTALNSNFTAAGLRNRRECDIQRESQLILNVKSFGFNLHKAQKLKLNILKQREVHIT